MKTLKSISIILVLLMVFNTFGFVFADSSSNKVNIKINKKSDDGTTKIEEGVITLDINNEKLVIEYSDTFKGDKKVTKLKYGDTIEIIETDFKSDVFSITRNGIKKDFNKKNVIDKTKTKIANKDTTATLASISSYLGTPYVDKLLASSSFSFNGAYKTARVLEDYDWQPVEYDTFTFGIYTAVATIAGLLTMGTSTLITLISSICAVIGGVLVIIDSLEVNYNSYQQDWNKWGIVDGDSTCYYYYHTGRTKISEIYEFSTGTTQIEVLSDRAGTNFYSNSNILNATITNYKAEHSY